MGGGSWDYKSFTSYSTSMGRSVDSSTGRVAYASHTTAQDIYRSRSIDPALVPYNIVRECCDSEEHPNTLPVILGLDVTGSMGQAAVEVSKQLNVIMTNLYKDLKDVEFCIVGIGDFAYDRAPLQVSQFESDIRIAEQLDKLYFEFGGGGNSYESYSAAWYFGLNHTKLDCYDKRGKKGIIITMGDERLNPYIEDVKINKFIGDNPEKSIETAELYGKVKQKFDVYHINVIHNNWKDEGIKPSFEDVIGSQHFYESNIDGIADVITNIIKEAAKENESTSFVSPVVNEPNNSEDTDNNGSAIFESNIGW